MLLVLYIDLDVDETEGTYLFLQYLILLQVVCRLFVMCLYYYLRFLLWEVVMYVVLHLYCTGIWPIRSVIFARFT